MTQADLYCLVRAQSSAAGVQRLRATLERYALWKEPFARRIVPVVGDLAQPRFGLTEDEFAALASRLDGVYHSGALVNFLYSYEALKGANVRGTQEAIRLACQGKLKPLHHISTLATASTARKGPDGRVYEDAALGPVGSVNSGYVQSKWVAEHLVLAAKERGLPASIYRPSRIMGHSVTGASNLDDFMMRLLIGSIQLGSAPAIDKEENLAPVDYMAKAIVHLSLQRQTIGQAFHLMNPRPNKFDDMFQAVNLAGFPVRVLPFAEWYKTLFASVQSERENVLYPLLPFLSMMPTERVWVSLLSMPQFDCRNTCNGLADSSIVCPTFNARHIHASLAYFIEQGILKPFRSAHLEVPSRK